jgi:hypothetical protein
VIVLSPALVVSLGGILGTHLPIIGWQNLVTVSNIVADHEDADFPAARLANPNTNELWKSDSTDDQDIIVTLSGSDAVNYVGIARHNFGSAGITVSIEVDDGGGYVEVAEFIPGDDSPLLFWFETVTPLSVKIHMAVGSVAPQAAVVFVGELLRMEWGVQAGHTPINYGRERDIITGRSEAGDYLGRIESGGKLRTRAEIRNLSPSFYREEVDPFLAYGGPFFFAWAPTAYPRESGYVWCVNDPVPNPSHLAGYIDLSLDLEGIGL